MLVTRVLINRFLVLGLLSLAAVSGLTVSWLLLMEGLHGAGRSLPDVSLWMVGGAVVLSLMTAGAVALVRAEIRVKARRETQRPHAERVLACIVEEGEGEVCIPAVALITFDRTVPDPEGFLEGLARKMWDLKYTAPANPDEAALALLVRRLVFRPTYWPELPRGLTGGRDVSCVSFYVDRRLLRGGQLARPFVYCLAVPGRPDIRVEMIEEAAESSRPLSGVAPQSDGIQRASGSSSPSRGGKGGDEERISADRRR